MQVHIGSNRLVITIEPITIHSDLPKDVEKILKYETDSIIKHNDFLAEHTIKNEINRLLFKYKHGKQYS